ncbi:MAG: hypothetical protein QXJ63_01480, partial [Candidatus Bathyarchaeia archaeon]
EMAMSEKLVQGSLIKRVLEDPNLKAKAKEAAEFAGKIVEDVNRMPLEKRQRLLNIGKVDEAQALKDAENFLKNEINAEIYLYNEEDPKRHDPKNRARLAKPWRPAIYVE